jgi:predicted nucleic acid-binding protein
MKIFLDTNILIDFISEREGVEEASTILKLGEEGNFELVTSFLSMANTAYIVRRGHTRDQLYMILNTLAELIDILPMDSSQFSSALRKQSSDFEDMLQYQCALAAGCDIIVTRNTRDFTFSIIPVLSAKEFLLHLKL